MFFARNVTRNQHERERHPCEEGVPGEEGAVVEKEACPAD